MQIFDRRTIAIPGPAADASPELIAAAEGKATQAAAVGIAAADIPGKVAAAVTAQNIPGQVAIASTTIARAEAAAYLGTRPGVEAAAAAAVEADIQGRDLVQRTDPGIPTVLPLEDGGHLEVVASPTGKVVRVVHADGSFEVPLFRQGDRVTRVTELEGYLRATVTPSGRMLQDALDESGRVPTEVLREWQSRMGWGTPFVDSRPWDILVVGGQSNSTQVDVTPAGSGEEPDPDVLVWDAASSMLRQMDANAMGLGAAVGRAYRGAFPQRRVIVVETGVGSSGFRSTSLSPAPAGYRYRPGVGTWDRSFADRTGQVDPLDLYARMISRARAARAAAVEAGDAAEFRAVFMSLGEDDSNFQDDGSPRLTQAQFAAYQDDFMSQVRADLGVTALPFVWGSLVPEHLSDNPATINVWRALVDTPRRTPHTWYAYGPENMVKWNNTRIHWSAQGQRVRGPLMIDALYRARLNAVTTEPLPPQNLRVARSGRTCRILVELPPSRVTRVETQYSVDDGATWVDLASPAPLWTELTVDTSAAITPIWVRSRTVNEVGTSDFSFIVKA